MISIVIPYLNDDKHIEKLIEQIKCNDVKDNYEVLIVDGKSDYNSRLIIEDIAKKDSSIRIIDNSKRITPCAINIGIKESKGEYIILLSAHCGIALNYIQTLVDECKLLSADVIGSVGKVETYSGTKSAVSIRCVLSSRFGVGNSLYRIGITKITEVDTVAYACYRKEVFNRIGLFDERLIRNQDLEINKRIKNANGKIILTPHTFFIYYARDNFKDFYKNNFANGYWSVVTPFILRKIKSQSIRHYVPFMFIVSILLSLFSSLFVEKFLFVTIGVLLLYIFLATINAILIKKKRDKAVCIGNLLLAFFILHFSYGIGSLNGVFDIARGRYKAK